MTCLFVYVPLYLEYKQNGAGLGGSSDILGLVVVLMESMELV